uniref:Glyco_18 domain-containing protein n=1 Tax=Caenorhabditis tropicalis TaxID=1561998 RepID=A0A1I7V061_9PELO
MGIKTLVPFALLIIGIQCDLDEDTSPVHYCFLKPPVKTRLSPNLLENITTCTHLVYGQIPINRDTGYPEYSVSDVESGYDMDNIRTFLRMKSQHPNAKLLIGVERSKPFEDSLSATKFANGLKKHVKSKRFDGIFVTLNGIHLEYQSSVAFIETLSKEKSFVLTFGITGRRVFGFEAVKRLQEINPLVEHIYLDMGELPSNEEPARITQINPLFSNTSIPFEETIQGTVEELSKEGILPSRVVVGLTAGGWRYEIKDSEDPLRVSHGLFAKESGKRVTYQEACRARGAVFYDWNSMNEITVYRQTWMNVNLPTMKAMGEKIKWILGQRFAGIGISDALADDPRGDCATDPLPAHRLVQELIRNTIPSNPAKCTRLCYLDPKEVEESFPIDNLKSEYCSHIVVHYFDLDLKNNVVVAEKSEDLVKKIDTWRTKLLEAAPKLILSIGSKQTSGVWQFIIGNDFRRKEFAESLIKMIDSTTADGIEISWTLEPMASDFDKKNLKSLIDDISTADVEKKVDIFVAATSQSSYSDFYDYEHLNQTASLIVLHSHRLHSESLPLTGHPSPLRATSSMKDQKMTWESLFNHWVNKGVARSKIVLSLTASTLSMQSLSDLRSSLSAPFGQPAFVSMVRSKKSDIHSQQEICESLETGTGITHWVDTAEVPYLRRYDQMVAYENARSSHIKAVWASMEGVGGLALHHIHQDDPNAVCNNRTSFPLLDSLSRAQVCHKCLIQHDFKKCTQHDFVVSCNFELKKNTPLFKTDIVPYERCTEVVVDQAKLVLGGNITFKDSQQEQVLKNLTAMRPKMLKCGMILSLSCGDSEKHLNHILGDNMTTAIDNVMNIMEKYKCSGVQLDCEKAIRRGNHILFNTFVRKLAEKIEKSKASNGCKKTLSARFSHFTRTPSNYYSISLLNRLSYVSIRMTDKDRIDLPFFHNHSDPQFPSTEKFVKLWKNIGMKPEKLVIELSPFGWQEGKKDGEKRKMTQGETCVAVGNKATFEHDYESLTGYTSHANGMVNIPMIEDFRYKIGFIQREELGGIVLNSVNGDDYTGICGRGSFPILKSFYSSNKCF